MAATFCALSCRCANGLSKSAPKIWNAGGVHRCMEHAFRDRRVRLASSFSQPLSFDVLKDLNRVLQFQATPHDSQGAVPFGKLERVVDASASHGLTQEGLMALDVALAQRNAHYSERFYASAAVLRFQSDGASGVAELMAGLHRRMGVMDRSFLDRVLVHCMQLRGAPAGVCVFAAGRAQGVAPSSDVMTALAAAAAASPVAGAMPQLSQLLQCMNEHGMSPPVEVYNARLRSAELTPGFGEASELLGEMSRGGTRGDASTIAAVVQLGQRVAAAEQQRGVDPASANGAIACLLPLVNSLTSNGVPLSANVAVQLTALLREHGQLHAAVQYGEAALASGAVEGGVVSALVLAYASAGRHVDIAGLWQRIRASGHILDDQPAEVLLEILRAVAQEGDHTSVLQLHSQLMARREGGAGVPDDAFQLVLVACSNLRDGAHLQRTLYTALSEGTQLSDGMARGILQHACELSATRALRCHSLLQRQRPENWGDTAVMVLSLAKPKSMQQAWQVVQGACLTAQPTGFQVDVAAVQALSAALLREAQLDEAMPGAGAMRVGSVATSLARAVVSKHAAERHAGGGGNNAAGGGHTDHAPQNTQRRLADALQEHVRACVDSALSGAGSTLPASQTAASPPRSASTRGGGSKKGGGGKDRAATPKRSTEAAAASTTPIGTAQPRPVSSVTPSPRTGGGAAGQGTEVRGGTPSVVFSTRPSGSKGGSGSAPFTPRGPKIGGARAGKPAPKGAK